MQSSLFIERIYQEIEMEILKTIGETLAIGLYDDQGHLRWQMNQLSMIGRLRQKHFEIIANHANMTVQAVAQLINESAIKEATRIDNQVKPAIDAGKIDAIATNDRLFNSIRALERQAIDITNMLNSSLLEGAEQVYRDIITQSVVEVSVGRKSLNEALVKTIKEWADKGIPTFTDKAGRQWSNEAYVNMTVRTTVKNVVNQISNDRFNEYDIDLVQVSDHSDSRPDHAPFQGKIYSRSGKSKKYPPLEVTGYGDSITGLVTGINCRHMLYAYIEGVSLNNSKVVSLKEAQKNYEQAQRQRYLERQIRNAKKRKIVLESVKAEKQEIINAKELIKRRQARMRQFIKDTERTRRYDRERVEN
ncbi:phage minor capsid protein [Facklamia sp. P13064]|uniref:phage minor capsid protein n=1 Tax=Facklamia sp. P13064 TaxID=3421953 RepID=UPI003D1854AB